VRVQDIFLGSHKAKQKKDPQVRVSTILHAHSTTSRRTRTAKNSSFSLSTRSYSTRPQQERIGPADAAEAKDPARPAPTESMSQSVVLVKMSVADTRLQHALARGSIDETKRPSTVYSIPSLERGESVVERRLIKDEARK
jgi:hypothetical protein